MSIPSQAFRFTFVVAIVAVLTACAVPVYDEASDKAATALQQKINQQFYAWAGLGRQLTHKSLPTAEAAKIRAELDYGKSVPFYAQIRADSAVLQTRLAAAETDATAAAAIQGWFGYIGTVLDNVEEEHAAGKLDPTALTVRTQMLNGTFRSIATYILLTKPTGAPAPAAK